MISLGVSEELEQVARRHQLHDDVDGVVVDAHTEHFDDVLVVKLAGERRTEKEKEREKEREGEKEREREKEKERGERAREKERERERE